MPAQGNHAIDGGLSQGLAIDVAAAAVAAAFVSPVVTIMDRSVTPEADRVASANIV